MSRQEAVDFISRKVNGQVTNELFSSSSSTGISRSESLSSKITNSVGLDSNSAVMTANTTMPLLNISFVIQEREKLTNWKKRYENQASRNEIQNLALSLCVKKTFRIVSCHTINMTKKDYNRFLNM